MKLRVVVWIALLLVCAAPAGASTGEDTLLRVDRAAFESGAISTASNAGLLSPNFTWTDSDGKTRNKSEILAALHSGQDLPSEIRGLPGDGSSARDSKTTARVYDEVGIVQEQRGTLYILRIWVRQRGDWRLLVDQAVLTGARPAAASGSFDCNNPCRSVPFQPGSADQADVIHAYQAVERAVAAHDSAAWGSHIADEFFAVTSNSDRPLDKAMRMTGLDQQKVGGIAPFPLVSARMVQVGNVMVMTSVQKPREGAALRVTRVWLKRNGAWLEAYSYQTTIQGATSR